MTTYLPRSAWTTVPAAGGPMPSHPLGLAIHWPGSTVPLGNPSQQSVANRLEGYRRYHTMPPPAGHGWSDIAYQVAIDQSGRVWDLRGIGRESAANGDQSVNLTYGACLFLLGVGESPSAQLLAAFNDWHATHWLARYPDATRITGHKDIRPTGTDCPGPITEALIKSGHILTAVPTPAGDDMTPAQEAKLDYVSAQCKALAELAIELNRRENARLDALPAAVAAAIPAGSVDAAVVEAAVRTVINSTHLGA